MKHFKKRTIALVLASVVTVVGAFGAENFKNSLMSLKFENSTSSAVNVTLLTKTNYEKTITPVKKDATTYIIMLPETTSQMSSAPELSGNIESVNVRTMPYTTNSKGYTKITIKTLPNTLLSAKKALYIPEKSKPQEEAPASQEEQNPQTIQTQEQRVDYNQRRDYDNYRRNNNSIHSRSGVDQTNPVDIKESVRQFESGSKSNYTQRPQSNQQNTTDNNKTKTTAVTTPLNSEPAVPPSSSDPTEIVLIVLGLMLALAAGAYIIIMAKNKMAEIIGEQPDFDINDEPSPKAKEKEKEKKKKIKTTIKKLDKMYTKPVKMPLDSLSAPDTKTDNIQNSVDEKKDDDNIIVDLDELFNEKNKQNPKTATEQEDEENEALEDFLSSFSFSDIEELQEEELYNEELFNKFINNGELRFSKSDIQKINELLANEISDDTLRNIDKFVVTNPITEKKPSHRELLENFVTTYTINQNISFSKEDIAALDKLMNVELDNDFITDLRTNPNRIKEMQQEFEKQKSKPHKTSELLTLNVKDMLPDLSEALKKQGGRKIESEVKPQVVYYSEGYDVSTLSLKDELPDLSKEINNADAYKSRPSDDIVLVESGYDVAKMSVSDKLPNLEEMLKEPEKYDNPKETPVKIDEEALLKNISNVTFKPFYDGSKQFEVINDFEPENTPSVSDMQEEFSQFDKDFTIINEEEIPKEQEQEINDFESLYDNNYVDFDKAFTQIDNNNTENEEKEEEKEEIPLPAINRKKAVIKPARDKNTDELLEFIKKKREQRKIQTENLEKNISKEESVSAESPTVCIIDNEKYEIINTVELTHKNGCYLAQGSGGYDIIGYTGEKVFKIKHYDDLKTKKIQARASEKLDGGGSRYIVRVGTHKFILNVTPSSIEYVMDLC